MAGDWASGLAPPPRPGSPGLGPLSDGGARASAAAAQPGWSRPPGPGQARCADSAWPNPRAMSSESRRPGASWPAPLKCHSHGPICHRGDGHQSPGQSVAGSRGEYASPRRGPGAGQARRLSCSWPLALPLSRLPVARRPGLPPVGVAVCQCPTEVAVRGRPCFRSGQGYYSAKVDLNV